MHSWRLRSPWLRALLRTSIRHPAQVLATWLVVGLLSVPLIRDLSIDTSTGSFLDQHGPHWSTYLRSLREFGGDEYVAVALETRTPFDRAAILRSLQLTDELADIPGVRRVDSLATVPLLRVQAEGELAVDAALADGTPSTDQEWRELRQWVEGDRLAPGVLLSPDERTIAINVILDENIQGDRSAVVNAIKQIVSGDDALVSGVPVFRTAVNSSTRDEVLLFVPLTLVAVGLVVWLCYPRWQAVAAPLLAGLPGALVALSAMAVLGVPLSLSTMVLPSILLALGCAYAMHVISTAWGRPTSASLYRSVLPVSEPIALSGLTTAIGFVAMASVRISAIQELATFGALGVVAITLASLTAVPASLSLFPLRGGRNRYEEVVQTRVRHGLAYVANRHRKLVVVGWLIGFGLVSFGIARLDVSTDIILWFPKGTAIRDSYEKIRERLSGITAVNVVVESQSDTPVTVPAVLRAVDKLTDDLEALAEVGRAISVRDPLRQMHRLFLEEDAGLPDDPAAIEQYLLLLSSAEYMHDILSEDRRAANILLRMDTNSSDEIVSLGKWIDAWWRRNGVAGFEVATTGIMYEFGRAEEEIAYGQVKGLVAAFTSIAVILFVVFRRRRLTLIALAANVLPIALAFGLMGLLGVPLDAATVCLGSLALGIAVDDTIHIARGFSDGMVHGLRAEEALDRCFRRALPAVVVTTLAISVGFGVLAVSSFTLVRNLGLMTAGVVFLCLLADLLLLPALLVWQSKEWSRGSVRALK